MSFVDSVRGLDYGTGVPNLRAAQPDYAALGWKFGSLTVQRFAAMLGPVTFVLPDGRSVSPLFLPPWLGEPSVDAMPGVITHLRGEWPCIPFGVQPPTQGFGASWAACLEAAADRDILHGHGSNVPWHFTAASAAALELTCEYPEKDDILSLTRRIQVVQDAPAVELSLTVRARRPTRVPIGLHFTFGSTGGPMIIRPGEFAAGWTYPGPLGAPQAFARDRRFADLGSVPAAAGDDVVDARRFPLEEPNEDLLQLNGVGGSCSLDHVREAYRVTLSWNPAHFPSLHLWLSNRAILAPPLAGRTIALGLEPVCSAFGLGKSVSAAPNPFTRSGIRTAIDIDPGHPFETTYRMSVSEISP